MTVDNILTMARDIISVDTNQLDDTQAVRYLNIAYHDIETKIISELWEDFFWDSFTATTVADQNEYALPIPDSTTVWLNKIDRVELKYTSTDTYKTLIKKDSISNYTEYSDSYYQNNQSIQNAFYDVRDWSIFVYPKPSEGIASGLVVYWPSTLIDLVSWGAETTIFPKNQELRAFHHVLAYWVAKFGNFQKNDINKKNDINAEYENGVQRIIKFLNDRVNLPMEMSPIEVRNYNLMI